MKLKAFKTVALISLLIAGGTIHAQSTDQMFPTPIRTSEITSAIKARAIGDPRVTTHYYTFEGQQGDVFINVQSKNFTGDIDVYVVPSQQPLTKIVIYGDQTEAETGRVVYLRKPERLLLRIQGRSPGDDDASVRIKFAGSFEASKLDDSVSPAVPTVEKETAERVRVNSVGTLVEVIPKPSPTPDAERLEAVPEPHKVREAVPRKMNDTREESKVEPEEAKETQVAATDPVVEEKVSKPVPISRDRNRKGPETPKVDPMAGINLVIYFKDGSRIDRPMTEVMRFSVERAMLTVISKNGTIGRYNMTEVSRVSIE